MSNVGNRVAFLMLNPSTADAIKDDNTIRRCISFAKQWGYAGLDIINLFAYRATDPKDMKSETVYPVGDENDNHILTVVETAKKVIFAWGVNGTLLGREKQVLNLLAEAFPDRTFHCLGVTSAGHPKHPLYVATDTELVVFGLG